MQDINLKRKITNAQKQQKLRRGFSRKITAEDLGGWETPGQWWREVDTRGGCDAIHAMYENTPLTLWWHFRPRGMALASPKFAGF